MVLLDLITRPLPRGRVAEALLRSRGTVAVDVTREPIAPDDSLTTPDADLPIFGMPSSEDSVAAQVLDTIEGSGRLSRGQVLTRILEMMPSASLDYLNRFSDRALRDYLDHVDTATDPKRRHVGWQRRTHAPAVAMRESDTR